MAKILLLDFEEADRDYLVSEQYDVELKSTGWKSGHEEPLEIPGDGEIVFYRVGAQASDGQSEFHARAHESLARRIEEGLRVVCFIDGGKTFQLTNITGGIAGLQLRDSARPDAISFNPRALFHVPFERYRPFISKAFKLLPEAVADGVWEKESIINGKLEFLAKSADGFPVAILTHRGKGYYILLPSFGAKNVEIVDHFLKDRLPFTADAPEPGGADWIDQEDYVFPDLKGLFAKREEENERHKQAMAEIDRQIKEMKDTGQEAFHRLLTAEGPDLNKAVVHALQYLGWGRVVNVDDYWKNVIRDKEEDIWLIESEGQPVEISMRKEDLVLVLVRGNRNWATDDECALLQKFKGRRMQEFDNTKMKAILIGNYFSGAEPKARGNPFSATQLDDARKDGNGLLTTYELFKAVKAEKEKRVTKAAVRAQIKEKIGLVTLEF